MAYGYAMTLKTLAKAALAYLGAATTDAAIGTAGASEALYIRACEWANLAAQDVANFGPWPWLTRYDVDVTVAAAAWEADLPEDVHRLLGPPSYEAGTSTYLFEPATLEQLKLLRTQSVSAGAPRVWALGYNQTTARHNLLVWPPASAAAVVTVPYTRMLPLMVTPANDYPAMPYDLHPLVRLGAMAGAAEEHERNWDSAERKRFRADLAVMFARMASSGEVRYALRQHGGSFLRPGRASPNVTATALP